MGPVALLGLIGLGGGLMYALSKGGSSREVIRTNGHTWYVEVVGKTPEMTGFIVKAPANSWGTHGEMPVLQFSQLTAPPHTRRLEAKFPDVPAGVFDAAVTDLGVPPNFTR